MNPDNFVVRPSGGLWKSTGTRIMGEFEAGVVRGMAREVAGLPSELEAKTRRQNALNLLMLNLQLAILRSEPSFERLRDQVKAIAGLAGRKVEHPDWSGNKCL